MAEEQPIGKITHVYSQIQVAIVDLKKPLQVGDKIHIKGNRDDFRQVVTQMQYEHQNIEKAKAKQQIGIKTEVPAHENSQVFKE